MALLCLIASAHAMDDFQDITPQISNGKADLGKYKVEITASHPAKDEVKFRIAITEGSAKFMQETPSASLREFGHNAVTEQGSSELMPLSDAPKITATRIGSSVISEFTVTQTSLEDPQFAFVLQDRPEAKQPAPPFTRYFIIRLKDMAKLADAPGSPLPVKLAITESDAGQAVIVAKGGEVTVTLTGNPTTGYTWALISGNDAVLKSAGDAVYEAAKMPAGMVGSGGTYTFTFSAITTGTAALKFGYARPWEKDVAPAKTFTVSVVVK